MRRPLSVLSALALALAVARPAAPVRAADAPDLAAVTATLEREIRRRMATDHLPSVSVALVRDGAVVWKAAYGYANVWAKTPATPETLYSTGSTFKTVNATAVMRLVEQGKLALDEPVGPRLGADAPRQPEGAPPITLRHLLTHTSGLPTSGNTVPLWDRALPADLRTTTSRLVADAPPGRRTVYSNVGFALAGRLAGEAAGLAFEEVVRREVLTPLGMAHTTFSPTGPEVERLALPYARTKDGVTALRQVRFDVWPAGDVYTTAEDLATFLAAHLEGGARKGARVLSEASCAEMHRRQFFRDQGRMGFGLAFLVDETPGRRTIRHDGLVAGMTAEMAGDLDRRVGVVLLANLSEGNRPLGSLARVALTLLRGEPWAPFDAAAARRDPVPEAWAALAGTYLGGPGGEVRVAVRDRALVVDVGGVEGWLVERDDGAFDVRGDDLPGGLTLRFVRDAKGAVTAAETASGARLTRAAGPAATDMDLTLPPEGDPVGDWEGELTLGTMRIPFAIRVRRGANGALEGRIDVPAQGLVDGVIDVLLHHGKRVHLEHGAAMGRAVTDAELDGDTIRGVVTQGPLRLPVTAFRAGSEAAKAAAAARAAAAAAKAPAAPAAPSPFVGVWEGDLDLGTQKLLLRLDVTGDTAATLDIPAQGLVKGPLEAVRRDGAQVHFELPSQLGRAVFTGTIDGTALRGTLVQAGQTFPFALVRKAP